MNACRILLLLFFLTISEVPLPSAFAGDPTPRDRFLRDYPAALERLKTHYSQLCGHYIVEEYQAVPDVAFDEKHPLPRNTIGVGGYPYPEVMILKTEASFAVNGPWMRLETHRLVTKERVSKEGLRMWVETIDPNKIPSDKIFCTGEVVEFTVWRSLGRPFVKILDSRGAITRAVIQRAILDDLRSAYQIRHPIDYSDLAREPGFSITDVSEIEEGEFKLLKVAFRYQPEKGRKRITSITNGWFVVSPDEGWVIRRSELGTAMQTRAVVCEVFYKNPPGRIPVPAKVITRSGLGRTEITIDELEHKALGPREFTLAAYGVPEDWFPALKNPLKRLTGWFSVGAISGFTDSINF